MSEQYGPFASTYVPFAEHHNRPLGELVDVYLGAQDPDYLGHLTAQIEANANPGFLEAVSESRIMVPISVDAAREPIDGVLRTIDLLNRQVENGAPPMFAVLHLNRIHGDTGAEHAQLLADAVRVAAREAKLPISFFESVYLDQPMMGSIKKDTVDASIATLAIANRGRELPEPFGIYMLDADMVRLAPKSTPKMYDALLSGASVVHGPIRHGRSTGRFAEKPDMPAFPQMDRVMWVFDSLNNLAASQIRWEIQTLSSLREYLLLGGIEPHHDKLETIMVVRRGIKYLPGYRWTGLDHQFAVTSARRPYSYLQDGTSPVRMWDGEFHTEGSYRLLEFEELHDIPSRWADEMVAEMLQERATSERYLGLLANHAALRAQEAFDAAHVRPFTKDEDYAYKTAPAMRYAAICHAHKLVFDQLWPGQTGGLRYMKFFTHGARD